MRKTMVEKAHSQLSVRRQSELLAINRNRLEKRPEPAVSAEDAARMARIDREALSFPEFGSRRMAQVLSREGLPTSRRQAARLMGAMGLEAVYRRPRTSVPHPGHKIYPYLLRDREVAVADEVWCADITYIPMPRGHAYLVAVMDWKSRAVLGWKLSNTLDGAFCREALLEAVRQAGKAPDIFNTDQGSQFTSQSWVGLLESHGIRVSMDGRGRWMDNVFIERLWRSVKHEGVYLWSFDSLHDLERSLEQWFAADNHYKPHQALDGRTPWQAYRPEMPPAWRQAA